MEVNTNTIVQLTGVAIAQQNRTVLSEVDLKITEGEFIYLIGKTGSGKSSLLKALYAALELKVGVGMVCGYDLKKLNRKTIPDLRRKLGIVFQDFNLLADESVGGNLRFVLRATNWKGKAKIDARVKEVLLAVGLADKIAAMPHELSGGEQQRVVIARALLNEPSLIIADEPTGNLDPETADEILLLLRNLARERNSAVLFATHDYRILEHFPARIIRCHEGSIFEQEDLVV